MAFSPEFLAFQNKRKSPLTYPLEYYRFADSARQIADPVGEYRKIRNVAMNRLRKLKAAGYGDTETVRAARETFAQLPKNLSADEAANLLPDAARFVESKRGTVGGMREIERKTAETFQDRGLDFVTRKNIRAFTEFLDYLGADKLNREFYAAVTAAPKEGRASKKTFKVDNLEAAFNAWLEVQ